MNTMRLVLLYALTFLLSATQAFACITPGRPYDSQIVDIRRVFAAADNVYFVEVEQHTVGLSEEECESAGIAGRCWTWQQFRTLSADHPLQQWDWRSWEAWDDARPKTLYLMHVIETLNGVERNTFLAPSNAWQQLVRGIQSDHNGHTAEIFWSGFPNDPVEWRYLSYGFGREGFANELSPILSCSGRSRIVVFTHGQRYVFFEEYWDYFRGTERVTDLNDRWLDYVRNRYTFLGRGEEYDPQYPADGGSPFIHDYENPVIIFSGEELRRTRTVWYRIRQVVGDLLPARTDSDDD